jgi:hypothetical protein
MLNASTTVRPWALDSWPTVFWQANAKKRRTFVHLSTRLDHLSRSGHRSLCTGTTIWGEFSKEGDAGLAWEWIEIAKGVVAMMDPMSLMTNLQLIAANGEIIPPAAAALHFNQFVRKLPWQQEVQRLLMTA